MAYTSVNFKTKKALKEAVASSQRITTYSPGPFQTSANGTEYVEGPHGRHTWYATVTLKDGVIVKVK